MNSGSDLKTGLIDLLKTVQAPKFEAREKTAMLIQIAGSVGFETARTIYQRPGSADA